MRSIPNKWNGNCKNKNIKSNMEANLKKRLYKKEWADKPLFATRPGSKEELVKSCNTSLPTVRRALKGGTYTDLCYLIRKRAYEEFGFGFIS